jgi:hypothetical protein
MVRTNAAHQSGFLSIGALNCKRIMAHNSGHRRKLKASGASSCAQIKPTGPNYMSDG